MNKTLNRFLQVFVLVGLIILIAIKVKPEEKPIQNYMGIDLPFLSEYFQGNIEVYEDSSTNVCHIIQNNGIVGHLLFTSDLEEQAIGFAGVTDLAVVVDKEYIIKGIEILNSEDSPSYIQWISKDGYLEQFNGKSVDELIEFMPDMITGATMSCSAIAKDIRSVLANVANYESSQVKIERIWLIKNTVALLFLVFALLHFFFPKKLAKTRIVLLILSIAIMGVWCGYMLSLTMFHSWLVNGVVLKVQAVMFSLFVFAVSLPLFTKRSFYCVYVCPFGAAQELAGKINPKHKLIFPKKVSTVLRWSRFVILLVIMILLILGFVLPLSDIEPFSVFQFQVASMAVIILAVVMIVLSVFVSKPWCRYFCPTGMLLTLLRKPMFVAKRNK